MLVPSAPVENTKLIELNTTIQVGTLTEDQGHQSSIGGYIDLNSNLSKQWKAQARLFVSLKIDEINSENIHFSNYLLDPLGENYALTNLAYLSYDNGSFSSDIGRIVLNTPFADTDDFRMALNTFEGIQSRYQYNKMCQFDLIALNSMSGIDARSIEKFSPFAPDSSGLIAMGFTTLAFEKNIDLWAYNVDKIMYSYFARYQYQGSINEQFDYNGTVAISYQKEQSNSKVGGMVISTDLFLKQDTNRLFLHMMLFG